MPRRMSMTMQHTVTEARSAFLKAFDVAESVGVGFGEAGLELTNNRAELAR
jgi:hypothetical protein